MKKIIVLSSFLALALVVWSVKRASAPAAEGSPVSQAVGESISTLQANESVSTPMAVEGSESKKPSGVSAGDVERVLKEIPTLAELDRSYHYHRPEELRYELNRSVRAVESRRLIERANAGNLGIDEYKFLAQELRRQFVLRRFLLARSVARMKAKLR